ncbi:MAG TPA: molybdopterin-dependent oxidoreductase, partial [Firmicutes bacterium]|nr:molybdopterin-dependent oxidoreductase [Bacillota bacterium]
TPAVPVECVANLALLCGKVGKYGCGVNPLRGQNNVQGACDMGCLPGDYTGYQKVFNPDARTKFEEFWGVDLPSKPGLTITEVIDAVAAGDVRCLYIMGENPMVSDPDLNQVEKALKKCELLIVQDIFLTETAELADVVLPASCYAEKDGTVTNTERRVQMIRKAVPAPGEAWDDWVILNEIMGRLGYQNSFTSPVEILEEIAKITPSYGGFSFARLEKEQPQWPCPEQEHPGTPILHVNRFSRGERALFKPSPYIPAAELPTKEYPLVLTTGRILQQYHTRTMTGKTEQINQLAGSSFVEINPTDAAKREVSDGARVKVTSARGEIEIEARITNRVPEGVIFIPFHFAEGAANRLTNNVVDPIAKIPEYKVCAAEVAKV